MEVVQQIALDLCYENSFQTILTKQLDENSRFLNIRITERGEERDVPLGSSILINIRRADDEEKSFFGAVNEDGTIKVPLPNWMLLVEGKHVCNISIIREGRKSSTLNFYVYSEFAPNSSLGTEEDEEYDVLKKIITDIENLSPVARTGNIADLILDFDTMLIFDGGDADVQLGVLDETILL